MYNCTSIYINVKIEELYWKLVKKAFALQVWESQERPRSDQAASTPAWVTASEYQDTPAVMADKVERLAALLKLSKVRF